MHCNCMFKKVFKVILRSVVIVFSLVLRKSKKVNWNFDLRLFLNFFCCKSTYHNDVDTSNNVRSGHWQYKVNFEVKRKPPANYALVIQYFTMWRQAPLNVLGLRLCGGWHRITGPRIVWAQAMRRFFSFTDVSSTVVCSNAVCFTAVSSLLSVSLLSVSLLSVPLLSVWARAADEESCCSENQFPVSLATVQLYTGETPDECNRCNNSFSTST